MNKEAVNENYIWCKKLTFVTNCWNLPAIRSKIARNLDTLVAMFDSILTLSIQSLKNWIVLQPLVKVQYIQTRWN